MMGSGKTTIGKMLSKEMKRTFIDTDLFIEQNENKTINELFLDGEKSFRILETKYLEEISENENAIISTGGGIVTSDLNMSFFKDDLVIFINRNIEDIAKDINTSNRPLLKDNPAETLLKIYNEREQLYKKYADIEIINDKNIDDIVIQIINISTNE